MYAAFTLSTIVSLLWCDDQAATYLSALRNGVLVDPHNIILVALHEQLNLNCQRR